MHCHLCLFDFVFQGLLGFWHFSLQNYMAWIFFRVSIERNSFICPCFFFLLTGGPHAAFSVPLHVMQAKPELCAGFWWVFLHENWRFCGSEFPQTGKFDQTLVQSFFPLQKDESVCKVLTNVSFLIPSQASTFFFHSLVKHRDISTLKIYIFPNFFSDLSILEFYFRPLPLLTLME